MVAELEDTTFQQIDLSNWESVSGPTIESIASEWNANVDERADELEFRKDKTYYKTIVPCIRKLLSSYVEVESQVLDVGCGLGFLTNDIGRWGYKSVGIDIADKAIEYAKDHFPCAKFEVSSILNYAERHKSSFDVCIANMVLHNLLDLECNLFAINQLLRLGGIVIASVPDPKNWPASRSNIKYFEFNYNYPQVFKVPFQIRNGRQHPSKITYVHRPLRMYNQRITTFGFDILKSFNPCVGCSDKSNHKLNDLLFCVWQKKTQALK